MGGEERGVQNGHCIHTYVHVLDNTTRPAGHGGASLTQ